MEEIDILKICDDVGFHVKEFDKDYSSEIYANYCKHKNVTRLASSLDTHYIMKDGNVIYIGNLDGIKSFVMRNKWKYIER